MKTRILALTVSLFSLYASIALGAEPKHARRARKAPVTILDMSTPDGPSSPLPDIVQKGKL